MAEGTYTFSASHTSLAAWRTGCPAYYKAVVDSGYQLLPGSERDVYNAAFGNVMHAVARRFYDDQLWARCATPTQIRDAYRVLKAAIPSLVDQHTAGAGELGVKYKPLTRTEIIARCEAAAKAFVAHVLEGRFFGQYTRAEAKISHHAKQHGVLLVAKVDLAVVSQEPGLPRRVLLLDWKSRKSEHVDPSQLTFDALTWYYKWGTYPDEVGFFYFEGDPYWEPVQVDFAAELPRAMAALLEERDRIQAERTWKPRRCSKCWACPSRSTCTESPHYRAAEEIAEIRAAPEVSRLGGDGVQVAEGGLNDWLK